MFAFLGLLESTSANADQGVSNWSPDDPVVTIINTSSQDKVYDVETDSAASQSAFQSCVGCITVGAGQTINFHPGPFNGALTANQHTGTRHEFNFASTPGSAWYDDDMERGMSDETLGPSDNRPKNGGTESGVVGEQDTLAKANAAWQQTDSDNQQALLDSGYFGGDKQQLTMVRMDANAPDLVVNWLQMDAKFNAYIGAGSVVGKSATAVTAVSDKQTSFVDTNKMTITIY
ncbi:hypothetical protein MMC07_004552 [Pseudocyphellaria aurata]|nr:hypothetical protein [Pseudocyphellaria aurata]